MGFLDQALGFLQPCSYAWGVEKQGSRGGAMWYIPCPGLSVLPHPGQGGPQCRGRQILPGQSPQFSTGPSNSTFAFIRRRAVVLLGLCLVPASKSQCKPWSEGPPLSWQNRSELSLCSSCDNTFRDGRKLPPYHFLFMLFFWVCCFFRRKIILNYIENVSDKHQTFLFLPPPCCLVL